MKHWLATLSLIAGCQPGSYAEFAAQVAAASCDHDVTCGLVGASQRDQCPAPAAFGHTEPPGVDVRGALANNLMMLHGDGAQQCIDATRRASCDPALAAAEIALFCHHVVGPAVPPGGACSGPGQCVGSACEAGRCVRYPAPGAPCLPVGGTAEQTCDPSVQFCGGFTNDGGLPQLACQRHKQAGDECATTRECSFGHTCTEGICVFRPQAKRGEPCAGLPCETCNFCSPRGLCEPWRKSGESCELPYACAPGFACLGLDGAKLGTCGAWRDRGSLCNPSGVTGCPANQSCRAGVCDAPSS